MIFFRPLDIFLLILLGAAAVFSVAMFRGSSGVKAEIFLGSEKVAAYHLGGNDETKVIETRIGPIKIQVGNGKIRVLESPCNHKICIQRGAIGETHEQIICLPAHLYVKIVGKNSQDTPFQVIDAFSY